MVVKEIFCIDLAGLLHGWWGGHFLIIFLSTNCIAVETNAGGWIKNKPTRLLPCLLLQQPHLLFWDEH